MATDVLPLPFINGMYPTFSEVTITPTSLSAPGGLVAGIVAGATAGASIASPVPLKGQTGLASIHWNESLNGQKVYANDAAPIGRTRGQYTCDGGMEMYLPQYMAFVAILNATNPVFGYAEISFNLGVSFIIGNSGLVNVDMIGCRIKTSSLQAGMSNQSAISVPLDLDPMYIKTNGLTMFSGSVAQAIGNSLNVGA